MLFEKLELDFIFVTATEALAAFLAVHILPYLLIFRERLVSGPGVSAGWRIRVETRKQKILRPRYEVFFLCSCFILP